MIYLDYNSTTPVDPAALMAMLPFLQTEFANPSSSHSLGQRAREAVERARCYVASLLEARPSEIIFTSGGSESNNMVIWGVVRLSRATKVHIITSQIEHPSILEPCKRVEQEGVEVTYLPVDSTGTLDPQDVRRALRPQTRLITIMLANNEVGTLEPLEEISKITREAGVLLHTDAAQAMGKMEVSVRKLRVDFLTVAGHKLYAPKGIGALFVKEGVRLEPLIRGGGQERGLRAGTEAVPLIVALGEASRISRERLSEESQRVRRLRDKLYQLLLESFPDMVLDGHPTNRLPNTLNVSFPGLKGAELLEGVGEVCASLGSACHEGSHKASHVLKAMGLGQRQILGSVRFSLGRWTTEKEVEKAAWAVFQRVATLTNSKKELTGLAQQGSDSRFYHKGFIGGVICKGFPIFVKKNYLQPTVFPCFFDCGDLPSV